MRKKLYESNVQIIHEAILCVIKFPRIIDDCESRKGFFVFAQMFDTSYSLRKDVDAQMQITLYN